MQNIVQKINKEAKIAVLCGGMSSEAEISRRSGKGCFAALQRLGYKNSELVEVDENIAQKLKEGKYDYAYTVLHGKYGEDGCIQGILEILKIPYTGCGVMASAICMNKDLLNEFFLHVLIYLLQNRLLFKRVKMLWKKPENYNSRYLQNGMRRFQF